MTLPPEKLTGLVMLLQYSEQMFNDSALVQLCGNTSDNWGELPLVGYSSFISNMRKGTVIILFKEIKKYH